MRESSSRGIIWQIKPYQETDALVTLLSETEGKLRLLAKGLRGKTGKRKGTVQPFSCLIFSRTIPKAPHGLPRLTRTEFETSPEVTDPLIFAELSLLAEVSDRFLEIGQHVPGIFELWRQFLAIELRKPYEEVCGFLVQFFSKFGLFPDFQKCSACGQKFSEQKEIMWEDGKGIFCCRKSEIESPTHKELSFAELKSLFFFQHSVPENFSKLILTPKQSKNLLNIIFQEIAVFSEKSFIAKEVFSNLSA